MFDWRYLIGNLFDFKGNLMENPGSRRRPAALATGRARSSSWAPARVALAATGRRRKGLQNGKTHGKLWFTVTMVQDKLPYISS